MHETTVPWRLEPTSNTDLILVRLTIIRQSFRFIYISDGCKKESGRGEMYAYFLFTRLKNLRPTVSNILQLLLSLTVIWWRVTAFILPSISHTALNIFEFYIFHVWEGTHDANVFEGFTGLYHNVLIAWASNSLRFINQAFYLKLG